jgi:transposase
MEVAMPKHIKLRTLTTEEAAEIKRRVASRTDPMRRVQRAKIIAAMAEDPTLTASEAGLRAGYKSAQVGPQWVKRFNEEGLAGLADRPRPGGPRKYSEEVRSKVINLVVQKPRSLGYPFELWTLERLQTALEERENVRLCDVTIWNWVEEEGFTWKRQESWFHETDKHDAEFVEKRGA